MKTELNTLTLDGKEYVVVEREAYEELSSRANADGKDSLPPFPKADAAGNRPAIEYGRILLARKLITARREASLSQTQLATLAGVRMETINRIEKGRQNATEATWNKIEKALKRKGVTV